MEIKKEKPKLPISVHFMCGWPLFLVAVGGAIGGGLGGAAYGVNLAIYRSNMSTPIKVVLNLATGASAIILWIVLAAWIQTTFQK